MNHLDILTKLKTKVNVVNDNVGFQIYVVNKPDDNVNPNITEIKLNIDEEFPPNIKSDNDGTQAREIYEKMKAHKLSMLKHYQMPINTSNADVEPIPFAFPTPKPKSKPKSKKQLIVLKEDSDEEPEINVTEPLEQVVKKKTEIVIPRGIINLGSENLIKIGNIELKDRLPPLPAFNVKVSDYYLNNRELFVSFINTLFEPYKAELDDESSAITCDALKQGAGNIGLLLHQKIIRDYINLYTPYRGLLLYHGLGSGKTCSSIAIAEGMKSKQKIIIMTPASLRRNYIEEIKKCGDLIYRKIQFWEWIALDGNVALLNTLASILGLSVEYITKKHGAWLVNVTKSSNYNNLNSDEKKSLNNQLDEMIENKYTFINYNGIRRTKFKQLTNDFTKNIFDDAVVIIDESHNLVSRIVNKINKLSKFNKAPRGPGTKLQAPLAIQIYEFLLRAENSRIVLLTGTPMINYPNEIGILFNILRGYIKTWELTLDTESTEKINKEKIQSIFSRNKILDYVDYSSSSKILTITRNPLGFENVHKSDYKGVANHKASTFNRNTSDSAFIENITRLLHDNNIIVNTRGTNVKVNVALPDTLTEFMVDFIDKQTGNIINIEKFKKRIIGLTSYFKSAQEKLLPKYDKNFDFHVLKIPMSDLQFQIYESARQEERLTEDNAKKSSKVVDRDGLFIQPTSTYRIFSRLFCNFVLPETPGRPRPNTSGKNQPSTYVNENSNDEEISIPEYINNDANSRDVDELEGDELLEVIGGVDYVKSLQLVLLYVKKHASHILSPIGLETYSPKFLAMLNNIKNPEHIGLNLIYSQFRTMEGIGLFSLMLECNGFARFKIKRSTIHEWEIDMTSEELGKPTFALYTGTEGAEEREIIRNIYNGTWDQIPNYIAEQLRTKSTNNNLGEIIKVFMITSAGSEGITLHNTRYVHIMEPYWHPVRVEQVIGRARRICSHNSLSEELQSVEVFMYLMTFTPTQLASEYATELKLKDTSKYPPYAPQTSDEKLFEISSIKEQLTSQLLKGIKESSIDCATYSNINRKENLKCLSFNQPNANDFSYKPSLAQDENDAIATLNKRKITWKGQKLTINEKVYAIRTDTNELYDYESFKMALNDPSVIPIFIGTLKKSNGKAYIEK